MPSTSEVSCGPKVMRHRMEAMCVGSVVPVCEPFGQLSLEDSLHKTMEEYLGGNDEQSAMTRALAVKGLRRPMTAAGSHWYW